MAHFAQLDENNNVIQVIVVGNPDCLDENGVESEQIGISFCKSLIPRRETRWIQTSYNGNIRNKYAAIGDIYDETLDAFIPPKPYSSWILNTETLDWESPVPRPDDENEYIWNEETQSWDQV